MGGQTGDSATKFHYRPHSVRHQQSLKMCSSSYFSSFFPSFFLLATAGTNCCCCCCCWHRANCLHTCTLTSICFSAFSPFVLSLPQPQAPFFALGSDSPSVQPIRLGCLFFSCYFSTLRLLKVLQSTNKKDMKQRTTLLPGTDR